MRITHATYKPEWEKNGNDLTVPHALQSCASDSRMMKNYPWARITNPNYQKFCLVPTVSSLTVHELCCMTTNPVLGDGGTFHSNFKPISDQC